MSFRAISKHLHFRSQRANRPEQPILAAEFDSRSRESSTTLPGSSRGYVSSHGSSKYDTASGSAYPIDKKTEVSTTDNSKSYYDAPPAYINKDSRAQSINIGPASSIAIMDPGSAPYEDPLFILTKFDTWFLVDDSGSMTYQGRWKQARNALADLAEIAGRYDQDGIDIHFLNSEIRGAKIRTKGEVLSLFDRVTPKHTTPTQERLEALLPPYIEEVRKSRRDGKPGPKPLNLVIITDGASDDDLEDTIKLFARSLDEMRAPLKQLGLQFVQVGNDAEAAKALRKLDEGLQGVRDMVDTTPFTQLKNGQLTADDLIKMLIGGINRKIDGDKKK